MVDTECPANDPRIIHSLSNRADQAAASAQSAEQQTLPVTLGLLEAWYVLGAKCAQCHRKGWLDRWELARRYGKGMPLSAIAPKLRCMGCDNRQGNSLMRALMKR